LFGKVSFVGKGGKKKCTKAISQIGRGGHGKVTRPTEGLYHHGHKGIVMDGTMKRRQDIKTPSCSRCIVGKGHLRVEEWIAMWRAIEGGEE